MSRQPGRCAGAEPRPPSHRTALPLSFPAPPAPQSLYSPRAAGVCRPCAGPRAPGSRPHATDRGATMTERTADLDTIRQRLESLGRRL